MRFNVFPFTSCRDAADQTVRKTQGVYVILAVLPRLSSVEQQNDMMRMVRKQHGGMALLFVVQNHPCRDPLEDPGCAGLDSFGQSPGSRPGIYSNALPIPM